MDILLKIIRRTSWIVLCMWGITFQSVGQSPKFICGNDLLPQSTQTLRNVNDKALLDDDPSKVYTIPVVFIIYHLGEPVGQGSNVSDADIQWQLDLLNQRYAGTGLNGYQGQPTNIRFTLAKSTPDCQSTTGIYRVDGRSVPNYEAEGVAIINDIKHIQLYRLVPVDFSKTSARNGVIVIKIFHLIQGFLGFAGYGGGVSILASAFKDLQPDNSLLSHEVGHVLSLRHTHEGSIESPAGSGNYTCPPNANPLRDNDMVADTDPMRLFDPPNSCTPESESYTNPCTGLPFGKIHRNIMNYGCQRDRLTPGQVAKMRAYLINELPLMNDSPCLYPPEPSRIVTPLNCTLTQLQPPSSSITGIGINYVLFQDIFQQSGAYPAGQYTNYSCQLTTQVTAGQSYQLTIKGYGTYGQAYLDFNNDGFFDESSERIMAFQSNNRDVEYSTTQSVTIPTTAVLNQLLRLRIIFDSGTTPPTACNLPGDPAVGSGEVEDYGVIIMAPRCTTLKSGSWNDTTLWSCGHLPTAIDDVTIQSGHTVVLNSTMVEAMCRNLKLLGTFQMQGSSILIGGNRTTSP